MNKYEQLSVAGEGTYGVVLKCKHKDSGETVAIKKFKEPDQDDDEAKRLTQREINILQILAHENIVQLKEVFRQKGILYLVFEYMEKCLVDVLEANPGGVGLETTCVLTFQLARALEHCHQRHIIHRDIKPDNLLINADNSLRLCDFGSACKSTECAVLTDYVATRWYRAPELLVSFNNYTAAVDMWGLGCVMAELTVGQALFTGETDLEQLCIIHNTLGPLTPQQAERCLELSDFKDVKFKTSGDYQTLKKRFGHIMPELQIQLLDRVIVMDPVQRLTAKAALGMPWFKDVQVPRSSARPPRPISEQGARPGPQSAAAFSARDFVQQKPRIRRGLSPCIVQEQSTTRSHAYTPRNGCIPETRAVAPPMATAYTTAAAASAGVADRQPVGIGAGVSGPRGSSPEPSELEESIEDHCEESIVEEISDDQTIPEQLHDACVSPDGAPGDSCSATVESKPHSASSLPAHASAVRPCAQLKACARAVVSRPVSRESARSSSLTPMGA